MGARRRKLSHVDKKLGKSRWGFAKEMENKKSLQKSLLKGSIKQSIYWIGVPSQKRKRSCEKRDNRE
tara:strand:+ start:54 stop:254 length:201 start_codon:yes stop_codon:yes gene_type:complete